MIKNHSHRYFCFFPLLYFGITSSFVTKSITWNIWDVLALFSPRITDIFAFSSWTASESLLLLVASQNQIVADNITSQIHNIYALIEDGSHIVAVDFDSVSGRVFWSDGTEGKIWSAFQNGTDRKVVSTFLLTCGMTNSPVLALFAYSSEKGPTAT